MSSSLQFSRQEAETITIVNGILLLFLPTSLVYWNVCWVHAIVPGEVHARSLGDLVMVSLNFKKGTGTVACPSMLHYVIVFIHNGLDLHETGI
jgi:hypothetical protein